MEAETAPNQDHRAKSAYVFVGGVDVSYACLAALCEMGFPPALAVGYDPSRHAATGYTDLAPLGRRYDFEVVRARDVNDPTLVERMRALSPALAYVIGWSQLVGPAILGLPKYGCVGIHPTRLPEGRGRAPIPWTILKGLRSTASTMFFLEEGVDDGDIVGQVEVQIDGREDAGTLYAKHRDAHVELVTRYHRDLVSGNAPRTPQDSARATVWPRRRPEDGEINWRRSAEEVDRLVRAVTRPFPGAFTDTTEGRKVIWRSRPVGGNRASPGTVFCRDGSVYVACGEGALEILEAEPPYSVE